MVSPRRASYAVKGVLGLRRVYSIEPLSSDIDYVRMHWSRLFSGLGHFFICDVMLAYFGSIRTYRCLVADASMFQTRLLLPTRCGYTGGWCWLAVPLSLVRYLAGGCDLAVPISGYRVRVSYAITYHLKEMPVALTIRNILIFVQVDFSWQWVTRRLPIFCSHSRIYNIPQI